MLNNYIFHYIRCEFENSYFAKILSMPKSFKSQEFNISQSTIPHSKKVKNKTLKRYLKHEEMALVIDI